MFLKETLVASYQVTVYLDKLKSHCYWRCRINQVAFKQDLYHSQDCLVVVPKSIFEEQFILLFNKTIAKKALNYRQKWVNQTCKAPFCISKIVLIQINQSFARKLLISSSFEWNGFNSNKSNKFNFCEKALVLVFGVEFRISLIWRLSYEVLWRQNGMTCYLASQ